MESILTSGGILFVLAVLAGITAAKHDFGAGVIFFFATYIIQSVVTMFGVSLPIGHLFAFLIIALSIGSDRMVTAIFVVIVGWIMQLFFPWALSAGILVAAIILLFGFIGWIRRSI